MLCRNPPSLYSAKAEDTNLNPRAREAAMIFALAEGRLDDEADEDAIKSATEALAMFRDVGDKAGEANSLRVLIRAHHSRALSSTAKQSNEALEIVARELEKFRASGERGGEAAMLLSFAEVNADGSKEKREEALLSATQARDIFKELGDKKMEATAMVTLTRINLGIAENLSEASGLESVVAVAGEAQELFQSLGDQKGAASALHWMAMARAKLQDYEGALKNSREARRTWKELGSKTLEAVELYYMGQFHLQNYKPSQALSVAREALSMFRTLPNATSWHALSLSQVVDALLDMQEVKEAHKEAEDGLQQIKKLADKHAEAVVMQALINTNLAKDDAEKALRAAEAALTLYRSVQEPRSVTYIMRLIADINSRLKEFDKAQKFIEDAIQLSSDAGEKLDTAIGYQSFARLRLAKQERYQAMKESRKAAEIFEDLGDRKMEMSNCLEMAIIHAHSKELRHAMLRTKEAQVFFQKEESKKGEAACYDVLEELNMCKGDFEAAARAADRGRQMWKEVGDRPKELLQTLIMAHDLIEVGIETGTENDALIQPNADFDRATKIGKEGLENSISYGDKAYEIMSLYVLATINGLTGKSAEAMEQISEAMTLAKHRKDIRRDGHLLLLLSHVQLMDHSPEEATRSATDALDLLRDVDDERGEALCHEVIEAAGRASGKTAIADKNAGGGGGGGGYQGPSIEQLAVSLTEMTKDMIGLDSIEVDVGLMDAGLDSLSMVEFRNRLSKEFSTDLPASLLFDQPSVKALSGFLHESLVAAAEGAS